MRGGRVSPLPRGGGLVQTQHGLLPVPAPATASLLTGFAWRDDGIGGERVTPTGAAILRHLVGPDGVASTPGQAHRGRHRGRHPDLAGSSERAARARVRGRGGDARMQETITIIAFDIDDMTGEEIAVAADRLRAVGGVLDLTIGQVQGKKGRVMQSFRLLVRPTAPMPSPTRCFVETSTIGLRLADERRLVLPRALATARPDGTSVGIKTVERAAGSSTKAESDDLCGDSRWKRAAA